LEQQHIRTKIKQISNRKIASASSLLHQAKQQIAFLSKLSSAVGAPNADQAKYIFLLLVNCMKLKYEF
jgi:hypothetical protein